mmetsp:Transcript_104166/g.204312  ORF Transcript_104166/g.204312 Transcript_104166/m.204312 type:complete len:279 (-) Transcript_104166:66-902(-)
MTTPSEAATGRKLHVLWGAVPDEGQSDSTNRPGQAVAVTSTRSRRGVKNVRCEPPAKKDPDEVQQGVEDAMNAALPQRARGESHGDSSETPQFVLDPDSSQHTSHSGSHSACGSHRDGDHIVFGDPSSSSEVSNEVRSIGASTEDLGGTAAQGGRGAFPSVGSELHLAGKCKPCLFSHTAVRCANGAACQFCHLSHRRLKMSRPCKAKRERFKAIADRQAREAGLHLDDSVAGSESGVVGRSHPQSLEGDGGTEGEGWADSATEPLRLNAQGRRILQL